MLWAGALGPRSAREQAKEGEGLAFNAAKTCLFVCLQGLTFLDCLSVSLESFSELLLVVCVSLLACILRTGCQLLSEWPEPEHGLSGPSSDPIGAVFKEQKGRPANIEQRLSILNASALQARLSRYHRRLTELAAGVRCSVMAYQAVQFAILLLCSVIAGADMPHRSQR